MDFYHCCPKEYFDLQTITGDWIPHYGSTWLAETDKEAYQGSQTKADKKVIIKFTLEETTVENHSDMPVCKRINRNYYLYRGVISKDMMSVVVEV